MRFRVELKVEIGGREFGARDVALLMLIDRTGSILSASRILGLSYSRAWERIRRIEEALGSAVVKPRRGGPRGGGTTLTGDGRKLVNRYLVEYRRRLGSDFAVPLGGAERGALVYIGTNDPALAKMLGILRERGIGVDVQWVGSLAGLAALLLGECDLTGIHFSGLGEENMEVAKRYLPGIRFALISGYEREQGFITRLSGGYSEILDKLLSGELRMVNRNPGSGTRMLIDKILGGYRPPGYGREVSTHIDVAMHVASGDADVGVGIRWAAMVYRLNFVPITWEKLDFVAIDTGGGVGVFIDVLRSQEFKELIGGLPGFRVAGDTGTVYVSQP